MLGIVTNLVILGLVVVFGVLHTANSDLFYQNVQEDQPLEWVTFWAFMLAAFFYAKAASSNIRTGLPWFVVGLSMFCFVVAMEEISWGQRLLGYETPRYFLEHNYQKELNLHNVVATRFRKLALGVFLAGYGLFLPLVRTLPLTMGLFHKLRLQAPPVALVPSFAILFGVYIVYPWRYTGEIVEAGMALAFLFSALAARDSADVDEPRMNRWLLLAGSLSLVVAFGFGSALWSRGLRSADPALVQVAKTEIRALANDLKTVLSRTDRLCGHHERATHFASKRGVERLRDGRFAKLVEQGLPEERAEFFMDPWSTAYWVRVTCNEKRSKAFLYSFGPNRRRDSSRWKRRGDDIGVILRIRHDDEKGPAVARRE